MSTAETIFAVFITLSSAAGLLLTSRILEGPGKLRRQMFRYYTSLSNAAVLLTHALLLFPGPAREALRTPTARYMTVLCILVTFIIFFFVLTRFGRMGEDTLRALGVRRTANFFVHYLVPGLTVLEWLTAADRHGLTLADAVLWLLIPLCYLVFCAQRASAGAEIGATGRLWPYPFMDLQRLGLRRWMGNMLLTLAGFFALGLFLLGVSRLI